MKPYFILAITAVCGIWNPLHAGVVYSTFGPGDTFKTLNAVAVGSSAANERNELAESFTPSSSFTLDSVRVAVFNLSGPNQLTVYLASGSSQPGAPIESFSLTGLPCCDQTAAIMTATSSLHTTFSGGTRYWIVLSANDLTNTFDGWKGGLFPIAGTGESALIRTSGTFPAWTSFSPDTTQMAFED